MASSYKINDECVEKFENMKTKKKYGYLVFKNSDDSNQIVVYCEGKYGAPYDEFKAKMNEVGTGFGAVYVQGQRKEGLAFMSWIPDSLDMRKKSLYSSNYSALKNKLTGATFYVECCKQNDLDFDNFAKRC